MLIKKETEPWVSNFSQHLKTNCILVLNIFSNSRGQMRLEIREEGQK